VRVGGAGPAVLLLHGYGETGDMWAPLAAQLVRDHTVIVPDLRGLGLSSRPAGGYDKKTQAADMAVDSLKIDKVDLVTHDIGNMVGYAFAAQHPDRVRKFVIIDAPLPGIGPWDDIIRSHALWHFSFYGPDAERLVKGRERIYLDRFWNEFSDDTKKFDEASREHYAKLYAAAGAMHAGFEQFKAFDQDAADNKAFAAKGMLSMPVLAIRGEKSVRADDGDGHARGSEQCANGHCPQFGPLGHGGKSRRDHQDDRGFSQVRLAKRPIETRGDWLQTADRPRCARW
jgi:pimeloyl-ACP methyl ester carboxylesterase